MTLGLLCLGVTLLGALKTQAQDNSPNFLFPQPPLIPVPLQPDFQDTLFQGKWYGIGTAENKIRNGRKRKVNMYKIVYQLKDDHSFNVTSTLLRHDFCDHWTRTLVPTVLPGQFTLHNMPHYFQLRHYDVKVVATNYDEFAIVYTERDFKDVVYFSVSLYGRTKTLNPSLMEYFVNFAKLLGLNESNIVFTEPIELCISD